jgi:hypothetical protein
MHLAELLGTRLLQGTMAVAQFLAARNHQPAQKRQSFVEESFSFDRFLLQTNGFHFMDNPFAIQLGLNFRVCSHGNSFPINTFHRNLFNTTLQQLREQEINFLNNTSRKSIFPF